MNLLVQRLHPKAILPKYAHPGDAGMDLYAIEAVSIEPGHRALIATGIAIALPPNTEAQVRPRSGLALKRGITVLNSPGTVDESYRGEIKVILINHGNQPFQVEAGMRIAQMVICPVIYAQIEAVTELDETIRGRGGFGSSGIIDV